MPITPQELIANLGELPPLPQVAARVLRLASDPDTATNEFQKVISTDQALTAQILKIANSAMFGMMREVKTLTQAIMTLGFSTIKSVVIAASAKNLYARGSTGLQERMMWEHALVVALSGRAYAQALRSARTEEVFLSGLMHDIGKSVMGVKFPDRYATLIRTVYNEQGDQLALELDTFGFDHTMVGEALMRAWNLSSSIEHAVRWHHEPSQTPKEDRNLTALVALGNQLALDQKVGLGYPESLNGATQEAMEILGLTPEKQEAMKVTILESLALSQSIVQEL